MSRESYTCKLCVCVCLYTTFNCRTWGNRSHFALYSSIIPATVVKTFFASNITQIYQRIFSCVIFSDFCFVEMSSFLCVKYFAVCFGAIYNGMFQNCTFQNGTLKTVHFKAVRFKTVRFKTVRNTTLFYKTVRYKMVQHQITVHGPNRTLQY